MGLSKTISWQPRSPLSPAQGDFKNGTKMKWHGSPSLDQDKRKQTHPSIRDLSVRSPSTDRFALLQWDFLTRKQSINDLSCNQAKTQEGKVKKNHVLKSHFNNQGLVKMRSATDVPGKPHKTSVRGGNTPKEVSRGLACTGALRRGHPFFMITRGPFRPGLLEAFIVLPSLATSFLIKEYLKSEVHSSHTSRKIFLGFLINASPLLHTKASLQERTLNYHCLFFSPQPHS